MLFDSGLSKGFWAEAAATAAYLINRYPKKSLHGKTPEEVWSGVKPDLSHLRIFGCDAEALIPSKSRGKIDNVTVKCKMLGYEPNKKGYRLWNIVDRKIFAARHVRFFERSIIYKFNSNLNNVKFQECASQTDNQIFLPINLDDFDDSDSKKENRLENTSEEKSDQISGMQQNDSLNLDPKQVSEYKSDSSSLESPIKNQKSKIKVVCKKGKSNSPQISKRKLKRLANTPIRFRQFETGTAFRFKKRRTVPECNSITDEMSNFLSLSVEECVNQFLLYTAMFEPGEPTSYEEAITCPEKDFWIKAIKKEIDTISKNQVWEYCEYPADRKPVNSKFVFKRKQVAQGNLIYKARLVAKGCSQEEGVDYKEIYAPVVRFTTLRFLIATSVKNNLEIYHFDIDSAFLHGELDDLVYMFIPKGIKVPHTEFVNVVLRLKKAIYGLKQAGRAWNDKIRAFFLKIGLSQSMIDPCVFFYVLDGYLIIVAIFVDDIFVFTNSHEYLQYFKMKIQEDFPTKDLGLAKLMLGINITRDKNQGKIYLDQSHYIESILLKFKMENCNSSKVPIRKNSLYVENCSSSDSDPDYLKRVPYQQALGSIMYVFQATRPDLAHAISTLSMFNNSYTDIHWQAVKTVLRYFQGKKL